MNFINQKRLTYYPRLIAIVYWAIFIINAILRRGWKGGIGGLISFDFLTFYAIGKIYWSDVDNLYNFATQFRVEQEIYLPTSLGSGGNIFSYPPYVAVISGILNFFPYDLAYLTWTLLSLIFISIAVLWLVRDLVHPELVNAGLSYPQMLVVTFSFFPVIFGLNLGQNHGLTFLLVTGIIVLSLKEKWYIAGFFGGLLAYKPHLVLGFLIIWLVWRKYKAIVAFLLVAAAWFFSVILTQGFQPYLDYLNILPQLAELPYGVGRFVELSLFALIATILPRDALNGILIFNQLMLIACSIGLAWIAYRLRDRPMDERLPAFILSLLYPFFVAPHILIHDMVVLLPFFLLWSQLSHSKHVLYAAIVVYFGSLFFIFITYPTEIALLALIPIGLLIVLIRDGSLISERNHTHN